MNEKHDLKDRFFESNNDLIELFNELYKNYDLLKTENANLINKNVEATLEINTKFGIVNLAKLNGEATFDAINYFNKLCPYCKTDLYGGHLRNNYEIDHFLPIAKGGQDVPWNLLPICRNCNRKKGDKFPYNYLDETTYNDCKKYLEGVLFKITNSHEDRLQRDEIIHNLLMNLASEKLTIKAFISELYLLFNIPISSKQNFDIDFNNIVQEIKLNKNQLFGELCGTYTTTKKVANSLFKNKPTKEQQNSVKIAMRELFNDCRNKSNPSYYSVSECRGKLDTTEQSESLNISEK
jgi:5-methylcytosine-specific restriction endonuclease McrA